MEIKRKQPRRMIRVRKKIKKRKKKKKIKMKMMRVKRKKIMVLKKKKNNKNQKRSLEDKLSVSYITSKGIKKREKKLLLHLDLLLKAHLFFRKKSFVHCIYSVYLFEVVLEKDLRFERKRKHGKITMIHEIIK